MPTLVKEVHKNKPGLSMPQVFKEAGKLYQKQKQK